MKRQSSDKILATGVLLGSLTACGGSGGSSSNKNNTQPETLSQSEVIDYLSSHSALRELSEPVRDVTYFSIPQIDGCLLYAQLSSATNSNNYNVGICWTQDGSSTPSFVGVSPDIDIYMALPKDVTKDDLDDLIHDLTYNTDYPPVFGAEEFPKTDWLVNEPDAEFRLDTRSPISYDVECKNFDSSGEEKGLVSLFEDNGVDFARVGSNNAIAPGEYSLECSATSDYGSANYTVEWNLECPPGTIWFPGLNFCNDP